MVSPRSCTRCGGALVNGSHRLHYDDFCVNCGWRSLDLPDNVLGEFLKHHGDEQIDGYKPRNNIGTGNVSPTGHERRQREARNRREA